MYKRCAYCSLRFTPWQDYQQFCSKSCENSACDDDESREEEDESWELEDQRRHDRDE
jgi:hypothetical protein